MTDTTTTTTEQLAQEVGAKLVRKKSYRRIVLGGRTLAYLNATFIDFKAADVAKAPKAARAKLTIKGSRAHLPIAETAAAKTLLKHVAEAIR